MNIDDHWCPQDNDNHQPKGCTNIFCRWIPNPRSHRPIYSPIYLYIVAFENRNYPFGAYRKMESRFKAVPDGPDGFLHRERASL